MARRPLEREQVCLDGGRRTTQLMRDSLGGGHHEQADGLMKHTVALLAMMTAVMSPMSAQVQGDSIRLQVLPTLEWTHGRFVSLDSARGLAIRLADNIQTYPLQTLGRVQVGRPKSVAGTLLRWVLIDEAVVALAAVTSPREKTGTYAAGVAVAAGIGLSIGAIELKKYPWRWRRVHLGIRAAT